MKKLTTILSLALLLGLALCLLSSCGHEHEYAAEYTYDGAHHWHVPSCEHPEDEMPEIRDFGTHTMSEESVAVAPGCSTAGKKVSSCTVCGFEKSTVIPATGEHVYEEGKTSYIVSDGVLYLQNLCDVCNTATAKTQVTNSFVVKNATEAQAALDAATEGTVIYLNATSYGTLYLRTSDTESTRFEMPEWAGGSGVALLREFKDVTILAAPGAKVDCFKIEALTYTPGGNVHTNSKIPYLQAAISLENVTITGITFTGNAPTAIDLSGNVAVDGLTIDSCKMNDLDKDSRLLYRQGKTADFLANGVTVLTTAMKNITVTSCTVDGAYQLLELRGTENLTVTGNTLKNLAKHAILLAFDGTPYTGTVTITDNTVSGLAERFLRAANVNATLTVTGNTVTDYTGADDDIVKITDHTGTVTVEGNTFPDGKTVTK